MVKPDKPVNGFPILMGMNKLGKSVYGGTVPPAKVAKNREKSKRAAQSRRMNRRKG